MTQLASSTIAAPPAVTAIPSLSSDEILHDCREFLIGRLSSVLVDCDAPVVQTIPALRRGFGTFFDEMVSAGGQTEFEQAGNLTASKIKLIDDNQLEFSIALAGVSKRLGECSGKDFPKLHLRLMTLLDVDELDATRNPVGAEAVCAGLDEVCGVLADNLDGMLEQLRAFEAGLVRALPLIYAELNERLVHAGVPPRQITRVRQDAGPAARPAGAGAMSPSSPAASDASVPSTMSAALYEALRTRNGPGADGVAIDAAALPGLLAALDKLQGARQLDTELIERPVDAHPGGTPGALRAIESGKVAGAQLGPADAASLEALALLFDAIHEDTRLPEAVKVVMDRLQIPLVKVTLRDPGLFTHDAHPARELVDAMACAAVGLGPDVDDAHPVCEQLRQIAAKLQCHFDGDAALLDSLHAQLRTFIARREQEAQDAVERYVPLAERHEQRELVALDAAHAVRSLEVGDLPVAIRNFLRGEWVHVLEAVGIQHGAQSSAFQERVALARRLVWSVQPKASPAERKQLVGMLPGLLKELNEGLDSIDVPRAARAPLLDACVELHSAALRGAEAQPSAAGRDGWFEAGKPVPLPADDLAPAEALNYECDGSFPPPSARQGVVASEATDGTCTLLCIGLQSRTAFSGAAADRRMMLTPGNWLQFRLPDGGFVQGRLGWIGPWRGSFLFTNPDWERAVLVAPEVMMRQLARGEAVVVGRDSFFDKAAEKALRTLA